MKELAELFAEADVLVNRSILDLDRGALDLKDVEHRILEFVNRVGALLVDEVIQGVADPVTENCVWVEGHKAVYKGGTALSFINRFGTIVKSQRRGYRTQGGEGRWHPMDEKLGVHRCCGYSPLMTYLLSLFGSGEAFDPASKKLSVAVGISISATAVQRNTESIGSKLEYRPLRSIEAARQNTSVT